MSDNSPTHVASGEKFRNAQGITAIKDGQKRRASPAAPTPFEPKPKWLRVKAPAAARVEGVKRNAIDRRPGTVCRDSPCASAGGCCTNGTAAILLMGPACSRACRLCPVHTGNPKGWLAQEVRENTAPSVERMALR